LKIAPSIFFLIFLTSNRASNLHYIAFLPTTIKFNVYILLKNSGVNEEKQKTAFNLANKLSEEMMRYSGPEFLQFKRMPENQDVNHSGKLTYPLKFETSCITIEPQKRLEKVKIITINNSVEINV
jgi:hypothetical protein